LKEATEADYRWRYATISRDRRYHSVLGKPLYRERFDEVMSFHEPGLAPAKKGSEWFHIRQDGKRAYGASFDRVWGFYYGLAAVNKQGKAFHITSDGIPAYSERFSWVGNFQENVCVVRNPHGWYFHILPDGTRLYKATYRYVGDFKEGYAAVYDDGGKSFHIDMKGTPAYRHRYLEVGQFHKGVAPAKDGTGAFHIDVAGNRIYSDIFLEVEPFYNGRAKVRTRDGKLIEIDERGNPGDLIQSNGGNALMKLSHDLVGYWKSFLLKGAIDLGIFQMLPSTTDSLSRRLNIPPDRVILLLRALRERGYVRMENGGSWVINDGYEPIKKVNPEVLRSVSEHWVHQMIPAWENLLELLKSSPKGNNNIKSNLFNRLYKNPEEFELYQRTMEFYAKLDYNELPDSVDFSKYQTIIDAGGGTGYLLSKILERAKESRGYIIDLPGTAKIKSEWFSPGRILSIPYDFFNKWPVKGDAIILAKVLHDWNDDFADRIIGRAKESLTSNGFLFIVERVLTEEETSGSILSLHQFIANKGRERTLAEYAELLGRKGMKIDETTRLRSGMTVICCSRRRRNEV
jgi:hypothetical protein